MSFQQGLLRNLFNDLPNVQWKIEGITVKQRSAEINPDNKACFLNIRM